MNRQHWKLAILFGAAAVGAQALAATLTPIDAAKIHSRAISAAHDDFAASQFESKAIVACYPPNPLPSAPSASAQSVQFTGVSSLGTPVESFNATLWREQCDATTSYLYLRVSPASGAPFVCGGDFTVVTGGAQYEADLTQSADLGSSFCADLYVPTTVLVAQWPFNPQYDLRNALTLIFSRYNSPVMANLPAQTQSGPPPITPAVGLWWNPNESGTGYTIDVHNGVMVVIMYSYKMTGDSEWYLASARLTNNGASFAATLDRYRNGQCVSCAYPGAPTTPGNDGAIAITFSSATAATVNLPGGRLIHIQPYTW